MRTILLSTLLLLVFAATALAGGKGNLQFHCPPQRNALGQFTFLQQDPVVAFGSAVSDHLHQGNRPFSATTTWADLAASSDSGCFIKSNHSLFIWPVPMAPAGTPVPSGGQVQPDGRVAVGATNFRYYMRNQSTGDVDGFPAGGFSQVIGNHDNVSDYGSPAAWQCIGTAPSYTASQVYLWMPRETSTGCGGNATLEETIRDPGACWDRVHAGPGLGRNDGSPANGRDHKVCNAAHPFALPVINAVLDFPHAALTVGTRLSSDHACVTGVPCPRPGLSAHLDDAELFSNDAVSGQPAMDRILHMCLNNDSLLLPGGYPAMDPNGLTCQEIDTAPSTIWVTTRPPIPLGQQGPNMNIPAVTH
jgi:hypothetical protein